MAQQHVALKDLDRFCRAAFLAIGADEATADAGTRAMLHGTRFGVDSHGVRLLPHYLKALEGGRLNRNPQLKKVGGFGAVEVLDADHAQGALGSYRGMERAVELARQFGLGAVAIRNSSHFGPAGAYALAAAEQGFIGMSFCNSDSFVRLHDGAMRFHGTNPISVAVPVAGGDPWFLDMATSAIPYNRVLLYRSLGIELPQGVASDGEGVDTIDPERTEMLAPLGGAFGFKGAALAGVAEIFSAVLTGMRLSFDIAHMDGPDFSTPRGLGAFVVAFNPDAFLDRAQFDAGMRRYVDTLRNSPARGDCRVMAPGDREWDVARQREAEGVILDPATAISFAELAERLGIAEVA
ncbi:MAG TPA: Ldh family oxidoreductase [Paracoccus sp. (in: a-proteobacteria)]|uniref:Ldh family oxidoreductase n=1 Tax=Paracoccus sp. TaxID=267 RepID=UPI002BBA68FC|nr:Ldh family oxidoreductase [Paracoccus sp. (in: a-proteobacteria)]HWL57753.1 Ldh family oxidoreductase [Paracoccus sp. (in: a-proteobacteria)]